MTTIPTDLSDEDLAHLSAKAQGLRRYFDEVLKSRLLRYFLATFFMTAFGFGGAGIIGAAVAGIIGLSSIIISLVVYARFRIAIQRDYVAEVKRLYAHPGRRLYAYLGGFADPAEGIPLIYAGPGGSRNVFSQGSTMAAEGLDADGLPVMGRGLEASSVEVVAPIPQVSVGPRDQELQPGPGQERLVNPDALKGFNDGVTWPSSKQRSRFFRKAR